MHHLHERSWRNSPIPADIKGDYHIGTPFVKTADAVASLARYFPNDNEANPQVLILVPVNLPIDSCMTLSSGPIKDDVYQTVQLSHGSHGIFYLNIMVEHDAPFKPSRSETKLSSMITFLTAKPLEQSQSQKPA